MEGVLGYDALNSIALCGARPEKRSGDVSDLYLRTDERMVKLSAYFPVLHGKPRVDDRRVLSAIIFINGNVRRWRDSPAACSPHETLFIRWKRSNEKGIVARIVAGLSAEHGERKTVMIEAIYLKTHRTATSMATGRIERSRLFGRETGDKNTKLYAFSGNQG